MSPEENADAQGQEGTPETNSDESPEYVTKASFDAMAEQLETLQAQLGKDDDPPPTEEQEIMKLYEQVMGETKEAVSTAGEDEAEDEESPMGQRMGRMEKMLAQMVATSETQRHRSARDNINVEFRGKYDDWKENEEDIWKLARQHPTLEGDQVYVLWKLSKYGPEGLTKIEQKAATNAAQESQEAGAADSEKPGSSASGKTREPGSLMECLQEEYNRMPAKPHFN